MLICLIEDKIKFDDIVWFDCGEYEFPQMRKHISKVENMFNVKISRVATELPFSHYMYKYLHGDGRIGYGWPSPSLRWCTNFKINKIKQYLAQFRPYNQMIGYTTDEMKRVDKSARQLTKQKRLFFRNTFPLIERGISEKRALEICKSYGFNWDGLYDIFDRVSCWCCPLQGVGDLVKLKIHLPEMYARLQEMNSRSPNQFKNDPEIWNKVEKAAHVECEQMQLVKTI
jgi:3'-phosphoadenosine 5'-phosphosulfate sulfotransferase (PAPS reductase)/FAD synthetase